MSSRAENLCETNSFQEPLPLEESEAQDEELATKSDNIPVKRVQSFQSLARTQSEIEERTRVIYSVKEKWAIVILASITSAFSTVSSPIYLPAIPTLEKHFHSTTEKINLTVTIYSIFQGISPMLWASLSDTFGRRPILIACLIIYIGADIGLALANSYGVLFGMRILQAFGIASTVAIAGGVVGDLTTRRNRGTYVGAMSGIGLIGNCFGPLIGGAIAGSLGWRAIFWFLTICSGVQIVILCLLLPETNHSIAGDGSIYPSSWANRSPYAYFRLKRAGISVDVEKRVKESRMSILKKIFITTFNKVYSSFKLMLEVDFIFVLIPTSLHYTGWFMSLTALSSLLASNYGFNITQTGCSYLASGFGALSGSFISGRLLSYRYAKRVEKFRNQYIEKGEPVDMTKFNIIGARVELLPFYSAILIIPTIIFGWTIKYHVHYIVPILMTFFNSFSSTSFITGTTALLVDLVPEESASANACINLCRCLLCAVGLAVVDKMITTMGSGWTFTLVSLICFVSMIFIYLAIHYGPVFEARRKARRAHSKQQS